MVNGGSRPADRINGITMGVVHLRKDLSNDVVAAITGSSAFGEIARSVFAFAKDDSSIDGERIMSHEKNNLGEEGMAFTYTIQPVKITTTSGNVGELPMDDPPTANEGDGMNPQIPHSWASVSLLEAA